MHFERIDFMKPLLLRVKNLLIRPRDEWHAIREEPATYSGVFRYAAVLAALPPLAAVVRRFILDKNIQDNKVAFSFTYFLLTDLFWYCMYVVNIMITGMIVAAIASTPVSRLNNIQGLKIAAYSFTPLVVASWISLFPMTGWIFNVAIVYTLYLLYLGIISFTSAGKKRAVWYAVASFLSAAVIVGVISMVEYFLESFLMKGSIF
jgi:hypothetical protein